MDSSAQMHTSTSLLARVRLFPRDEAAWALFVERYSPKIQAWCRAWRLQAADVDEVSQMVLLKLADKMRTFAYDPSQSFRAWLKTLTHHAWQDYLQSRRRPGVGAGGSQVLEQLATLEARDDLVVHLQEEHDRAVLEEAMARVQARVAAHTWDAFRLLTFENRSGKEAAAALDLEITTVYMAKSRVQKLLREEIDQLGGENSK
jgi:RNA polymerase sigma factor (sigma-70 family)